MVNKLKVDASENLEIEATNEEIKILWVKVSSKVNNAFDLCWDCADSSAGSCENP